MFAGTKTVAGYWNEIAANALPARVVASLPQTARLFALLNLAAYDNNIAVWCARLMTQ